MVGLPQIALVRFTTAPLTLQQHLFCHVGEGTTTSVALSVETRVALE
jgi:hypothetical protein